MQLEPVDPGATEVALRLAVAGKLTDQEVAAVLSYIRNEWGNQASMVQPGQVNRYRVVPLD